MLRIDASVLTWDYPPPHFLKINMMNISIKIKYGFVVLSLSASLLFTTGCQSLGPAAAGGGATGVLAGTVAGAAIGAREGKSPEGALIGAVAGGTLGTVAGNAIDRQVERDRNEFNQALTQQQQAAVTVHQVIQMTESGLGGNVIVNQIHSLGVARRPSIDDLITLKNRGVDDVVIQSLQNAPLAGAVLVANPDVRPVVVHPRVVSPGIHYGHGYHRRGRRHRGGFSFYY